MKTALTIEASEGSLQQGQKSLQEQRPHRASTKGLVHCAHRALASELLSLLQGEVPQQAVEEEEQQMQEAVVGPPMKVAEQLVGTQLVETALEVVAECPFALSGLVPLVMPMQWLLALEMALVQPALAALKILEAPPVVLASPPVAWRSACPNRLESPLFSFQADFHLLECHPLSETTLNPQERHL